MLRYALPRAAVFVALLSIFSGKHIANATAASLFARGEKTAKLRAVPTNRDHRNLIRASGRAQLGFRYKFFDLFWLDLWTWGGEYGLMVDDRFEPVSRSEAARLLGVREKDLPTPWLFRHPLGLLALTGLGAFFLAARLFAVTDLRRVRWLLQDARYIRAMEVFDLQLRSSAPVGANGLPAATYQRAELYKALDAAAAYLESQGLSSRKARRNVALLVHAAGMSPQDAAKPAIA